MSEHPSDISVFRDPDINDIHDTSLLSQEEGLSEQPSWTPFNQENGLDVLNDPTAPLPFSESLPDATDSLFTHDTPLSDLNPASSDNNVGFHEDSDFPDFPSPPQKQIWYRRPGFIFSVFSIILLVSIIVTVILIPPPPSSQSVIDVSVVVVVFSIPGMPIDYFESPPSSSPTLDYFTNQGAYFTVGQTFPSSAHISSYNGFFTGRHVNSTGLFAENFYSISTNKEFHFNSDQHVESYWNKEDTIIDILLESGRSVATINHNLNYALRDRKASSFEQVNVPNNEIVSQIAKFVERDLDRPSVIFVQLPQLQSSTQKFGPYSDESKASLQSIESILSEFRQKFSFNLHFDLDSDDDVSINLMIYSPFPITELVDTINVSSLQSTCQFQANSDIDPTVLLFYPSSSDISLKGQLSPFESSSIGEYPDLNSCFTLAQSIPSSSIYRSYELNDTIGWPLSSATPFFFLVAEETHVFSLSGSPSTNKGKIPSGLTNSASTRLVLFGPSFLSSFAIQNYIVDPINIFPIIPTVLDLSFHNSESSIEQISPFLLSTHAKTSRIEVLIHVQGLDANFVASHNYSTLSMLYNHSRANNINLSYPFTLEPNLFALNQDTKEAPVPNGVFYDTASDQVINLTDITSSTPWFNYNAPLWVKMWEESGFRLSTLQWPGSDIQFEGIGPYLHYSNSFSNFSYHLDIINQWISSEINMNYRTQILFYDIDIIPKMVNQDPLNLEPALQIVENHLTQVYNALNTYINLARSRVPFDLDFMVFSTTGLVLTNNSIDLLEISPNLLDIATIYSVQSPMSIWPKNFSLEFLMVEDYSLEYQNAFQNFSSESSTNSFTVISNHTLPNLSPFFIVFDPGTVGTLDMNPNNCTCLSTPDNHGFFSGIGRSFSPSTSIALLSPVDIFPRLLSNLGISSNKLVGNLSVTNDLASNIPPTILG